MQRQDVEHDVDLKLISLRQKLSDSEISPRTITYLNYALDEALSRAGQTKYAPSSQSSVNQITSFNQASARRNVPLNEKESRYLERRHATSAVDRIFWCKKTCEMSSHHFSILRTCSA
jgi:hypothetical protein